MHFNKESFDLNTINKVQSEKHIGERTPWQLTTSTNMQNQREVGREHLSLTSIDKGAFSIKHKLHFCYQSWESASAENKIFRSFPWEKMERALERRKRSSYFALKERNQLEKIIYYSFLLDLQCFENPLITMKKSSNVSVRFRAPNFSKISVKVLVVASQFLLFPPLMLCLIHRYLDTRTASILPNLSSWTINADP